MRATAAASLREELGEFNQGWEHSRHRRNERFLAWRKERQSLFWDWEATFSSRQGGASTWSERAATTAHVTHTLLRLRVGVTLLTSEAWAWQVETTPQKSRLSGNER